MKTFKIILNDFINTLNEPLCDCCFYICIEEYSEIDECIINNVIIDFDPQQPNFDDLEEYNIIVSGTCLDLLVSKGKGNKCYGCEHPYISDEQLANDCTKVVNNLNISSKPDTYTINIPNTFTSGTNSNISSKPNTYTINIPIINILDDNDKITFI